MKARMCVDRVHVSRAPGEHPICLQAGSFRLYLTNAEAVDLADALIDATEQPQEHHHG